MKNETLLPSQLADAQIFICHDKPCAKKKSRLKKLMKLFPMAKPTKCMGVCKGPVVLVKKEKQKYYFKKIRKKKDRNRLWDFILFNKRDKKLRYKIK